MKTNRIAMTLAAAALAATCAVAAPASQTKPDGKPNLVFGVISDTHVRLAKGGGGINPEYGTDTLETALEWFRDRGADAVVIAGDITDSGLRGELKAIADTWFKVFPGDHAPDGRKVERVFIFGNHDAAGEWFAKRWGIFTDPETLRREAISTDPQGVWRECFGEEIPPQYYTKTVNGYKFFCANWPMGKMSNGYAETVNADCAAAFADEMAKCDPKKPFFYVQHPHPRHTLYANGAWGQDDGSSVELLSRFPQAIAFSGHSHAPLTDERALRRDVFTSIGTGSLRNISAGSPWNLVRQEGYENGNCNYWGKGISYTGRGPIMARFDAPKTMPSEARRKDIRVGLLVSVHDDRVVIKRREFLSGLELGEDWVMPVPARPLSLAERAAKSAPPQFPKGATLAAKVVTAKTRGVKHAGTVVNPEEKTALRLDFPAATDGGHVIDYEIAVDGGEGERFEERVCAIGGLYPPGHPNSALPERAIISLDRLPAGATTAQVTPLDSFGNRGRPLSVAIPGEGKE